MSSTFSTLTKWTSTKGNCRVMEEAGGSWGHMAAKTAFCHILQRSRVMDVKIGPSLGYSKGHYRNLILYDTLFDLQGGFDPTKSWRFKATNETKLLPKPKHGVFSAFTKSDFGFNFNFNFKLGVKVILKYSNYSWIWCQFKILTQRTCINAHYLIWIELVWIQSSYIAC